MKNATTDLETRGFFAIVIKQIKVIRLHIVLGKFD